MATLQVLNSHVQLELHVHVHEAVSGLAPDRKLHGGKGLACPVPGMQQVLSLS